MFALAGVFALGCSDDDDRVSTGDAPAEAGPSNVGFPAIDGNESGVLLVEGSPVGRAALLDATGEEQWEVDLPFDVPLGLPSVAVLPDGRFFVAGVSCSSTEELTSAGEECLPGALQAAVLDTADRQWTAIDPVDLDAGTWVEAIGVAGDQAVVQVGNDFFVWPLTGGALQSLPPQPQPGVALACAGPAGLAVAVTELQVGEPLGTGQESPGSTSSVPRFAGSPMNVSVYDFERGTWSTPTGPEAFHDDRDSFSPACLDDAVLAVPSELPMTEGAPHVAFRFDLVEGTWSEIPPPPIEGLADWPASDGTSFAMPVFQYQAEPHVLAYSDAAGWTAQPGGPGEETLDTVLVGEDLLYTDRTGPATVRVFEDALGP